MRFFDTLNTPKAAGIALAVALVVNAWLFWTVYSPNTAASVASLPPVERVGAATVAGAPGVPEATESSAGESQYR
jgi:hypothetical protein